MSYVPFTYYNLLLIATATGPTVNSGTGLLETSTLCHWAAPATVALARWRCEHSVTGPLQQQWHWLAGDINSVTGATGLRDSLALNPLPVDQERFGDLKEAEAWELVTHQGLNDHSAKWELPQSCSPNKRLIVGPQALMSWWCISGAQGSRGEAPRSDSQR